MGSNLLLLQENTKKMHAEDTAVLRSRPLQPPGVTARAMHTRVFPDLQLRFSVRVASLVRPTHVVELVSVETQVSTVENIRVHGSLLTGLK